MSINLTKPAQGTVDWATVINQNFTAIETAINGLAGLDFVASHTQTGGTVASFDITGLAGETDGIYVLASRFVNANSGGSEWFGVKPIRSTSTVDGTYDGHDFEVTTAGTYNVGVSGNIPIGPAPASRELWAFTVFFPRLTLGSVSRRRGAASIGFFGDGAAPASATALDTGAWSNTTDAITGLRFCLASGGTQIGNGTHVAVFKARLS